MRRRDSISCVLGIIAAPAALAQLPARPKAIGYLHWRTIAPANPTLKILSKAWQSLGYVEGTTVFLRAAGSNFDHLRVVVSELVDLGSGVLIVVGAPAIVGANLMFKDMPIVGIELGMDPVRAGLAASLGRPGGSVTGLFTNQNIVAKWIDLLLVAVPSVKRVAVLSDSGTETDQVPVANSVGKIKGLEIIVLVVGALKDVDETLRVLSAGPKTGIVQLSITTMTIEAVTSLGAAAMKYQIPMVVQLRSWLVAGALMSYGPIVESYFPRAAVLADKILNGAKPGELPMEGPDRYEMVINLKAAKALDVTIPHMLRRRAHEVIE